MSIWDTYGKMCNVRGNTKVEAFLKREAQSIYSHLPDNPSYFDVTIDDVPQTVAIIDSDNLEQKLILSLPGQKIRHGGLVHWMDNYWLINELDYNTTLYMRGKLLQCNYLLKWVTEDNEIHEQWCAVEDGTKLKHTNVCNSLAYLKRYVITIPLIAGNTLEPKRLQRIDETS